MKAVAYFESLAIDNPRALQDVELPEPVPGPRDLLVEVRAGTDGFARDIARMRASVDGGETPEAAIKRADRISARLEALQIAGFSQAEADRLFPVTAPDWMQELEIRLRPPVETRLAYISRFDALIALIDGAQ